MKEDILMSIVAGLLAGLTMGGVVKSKGGAVMFGGAVFAVMLGGAALTAM